MTCYVCGAKLSDMNNLEHIKRRSVDESTYSFGLSLLHYYIKSFECLLHSSYWLEIKKWEVSVLRSRMGLVIDALKQGSGTSNDGNTARRFFADSKSLAEITG